METIFKTKSIFTRDLCSSPWGFTPLALGREGSYRGQDSNKKLNWYCFGFCHSKETHTHHRLPAHFCGISAIVLQPCYATLTPPLIGNWCPKTNAFLSLMFYSELKSGPKKRVLMLQLHACSVGGCVCVLNMHSWFRHLLFGARVRGSDSSKEGGRRRRRRRQPEDMERNRLWKERTI